MATHKLQFQDVSSKSITYVDPLNVNNSFVHKSEKVRKNVATIGRVSFFRNEFAQIRQFGVKGCESNCEVQDTAHSRVILSGADTSELLKNWTDLKANVDTAIASGCLNGLRLPLDLKTLIVTDVEVPVP